jgi:UDP-2,3-diacylglucosamine hydrolase
VSDSTNKPFLIVSDIHLGAIPEENERRFREFLDYAAREASGLLINGDLFEFGIAYRSVVPRKHVRVLAKLADVVEAGVPVYFVPGNHDYVEWGGHVLEEDIGVKLLPDPTIMDIAGRRALITHGDTVGDGATRSRIERWLARSWPVATFLRWLHPDLAAWLQPYTTTTRRQVALRDEGGGPKSRAPEIETWAREALRNDRSLDVVIAAHAHLPTCVEVEPGRYYLNAGDWIAHCTFMVMRDGRQPELREWRMSPR